MIPLKIETLLEGRVVEHDRVEYKTGWNPNDIIHSICAFANDYDNTNGGYIVIGVKESNGMPVFPLEGVLKEKLDSIQQEIFQYCNQIIPRYIPRIEVVDYKNEGIYLIYLWCSAGDSGPYQAPKSVYAENPEKLIPGAYIELIRFHSEEAEASDDFTEKIFTGPIWRQVQDALNYIKTTVIEQKVVKVQGQAEAERYFNYPYNALEETLVNAVFHKSYREPEPVEIRIYVDSIQILNYPGLAKWINLERFVSGKVKGRKYRNRRIGELFKEIDLSEKKGTGIPKILRELK